MSRFDETFGWRYNWTFHPNRRVVKGHSQSEQKNESDSGDSEPNQRASSISKIEQVRKKLNKPFECVTEPFKKTLELLEDWEWDV